MFRLSLTSKERNLHGCNFSTCQRPPRDPHFHVTSVEILMTRRFETVLTRLRDSAQWDLNSSSSVVELADIEAIFEEAMR